MDFKKYTRHYCKYCGNNVNASFNWSFIHPECISLGNNFSANSNLRLQCWPEYMEESTRFCRDDKNMPELIIGDNVSMASNCQISSVNRVEIGSGCLFGDNVFITDNFHGGGTSVAELTIPPVMRKLSSKGSVTIGKNCWFGRNVCVMPGVTIGDGCVIGANAVVTHDIPSYSVAVGIPATVLRILNSSLK